jgi:hypothetical protein
MEMVLGAALPVQARLLGQSSHQQQAQACLVLLAGSSRALARLMPRQRSSSSRVLHQMTLVQGMQPVWQSLVRS